MLVAGVAWAGPRPGGRFLKEQKPALRLVVAEPGDARASEEVLYPEEIDGVHRIDVEPEQLPGNYAPSWWTR